MDKTLVRHSYGTITLVFLVFLVCAASVMVPVGAANTTLTVSPTQTITQVTTAATTTIPSTTHTTNPVTSTTTTAVTTTHTTTPVTSQTTTAVTTAVPTQVNPVVAFSADVTEGPAPLEVEFTDMSTGGPTLWSWDFGDDTSDTVQHPIHTYQDAGTYTVRMTATTRTGSSSSTREDYIIVESAVTTTATTTATTTTTTTSTTTATTGSTSLLADFTGSPRSGAGSLTVVFSDTTVGTPVAWSWDFGDGATETTQNPVHMYTEVGTYTVSLTVNSSGSGKKVKKADFITVTSSSDTTLPERTLAGSGGGGSQVRASGETGASSDQNSGQRITKTPVPTLTGKAWLDYEKQRMAEVDAIAAAQQNTDVISLLLNFFRGLIPWK